LTAFTWKDRLTRTGMGRVFRYPDFVLFSFAGWIASLGSWLQRLGIQWMTWELTHSYAWLGAVAFIDALSVTLFLPVFGTLIDRGDRLALGRLAQMLSTLMSTLLWALTVGGLLNIWLLAFMMALRGLTESFWTPVRMALPPAMVPRDALAPALGITSALFNIAQILGPALAGPVIVGFDDVSTGVGILYLLAAVSSLYYLWALYRIRLTHAEAVSKRDGSFFADFKEGLRYAATKDGLALFMLLMIASTGLLRAFRELLAGYADNVFHQGPQGLAFLTSAIGAGALISALMVANLSNVIGLTRKIFMFFALSIVLQFGFALTPNFWVAVACTGGMGLAMAVGGIGSQVLVQSSIHGVMRGRVMSLWALILRGGPPIGAWLIGLASEVWDFREVMTGVTILYCVIFLFMLPRLPYLAQRLETLPEGEPSGARA